MINWYLFWIAAGVSVVIVVAILHLITQYAKGKPTVGGNKP